MAAVISPWQLLEGVQLLTQLFNAHCSGKLSPPISDTLTPLSMFLPIILIVKFHIQVPIKATAKDTRELLTYIK